MQSPAGTDRTGLRFLLFTQPTETLLRSRDRALSKTLEQERLKWLQFTTKLADDVEQLLVVSDSLGTVSTHAP